MTSHLVVLFFNQLTTAVVLPPDKGGWDFVLPGNRSHFIIDDNKSHYVLADNRGHFDSENPQ